MVLALLTATAVTACENQDGDVAVDEAIPETRTAPENPVAEKSADEPASPGKPTAPISIDYTVTGTPIVGQPLNIDLQVTSTLSDRPITLNYDVVDATALLFPEAQVKRVSLGMVDELRPAGEQVTVVPQRDGRLYLNVTAEIETESGTLLKSMAIPIQVGSAPPELDENGELMEDADGDAILSMPADDNARD